jgi:hypothetical protein
LIIAEPAHPSVAVLIDAEPADMQVVDLRQQHCSGIDRGLHRPPRHPNIGGDLGDGTARVDHCAQQCCSQPGRAASPQRQLVGGRGERPPSTGRLCTNQSRLANHHLHSARVRHITNLLLGPSVHP